MHECDVAVIGAGPGGYVAAIRAAQRGAKTVVIEREELGGMCLNWGCIPTKTLIHAAELYRKLHHAEQFGLIVRNPKMDLKALVEHKNGVVKKLTGGVRSLLKANGVEVVKGEAVFEKPNVLAAGKEKVRAKAVILATGSIPAQLPGLETDGERVITAREALDLTKLPERIAVIGAGPLGAEFACLWNALGAGVTLIEMLPNVLPAADEELTKRLGALLKKRGIEILTKTAVRSIEKGKKSVALNVEGAKASTIEVDLVLVGIGFKHRSEIAVSMGVRTGKRGAVTVNERMETNVPGVYAIGDVVGKTMLAHGASAEGIVAAENATGGNRLMDYRVVPSCSYTSPEVASVGLTEQAAQEAGKSVRVGRFPYAASGRAMSMGEVEGMVKIVADAATGEVLGVHIMGAEAGEMIAAGAVAMAMEATVDELAHTIFTHPTLSETLMEAAEDYLGLGIHTPPRKKQA